MTVLAAESIAVDLGKRPVLRNVSLTLNGYGLTAIIGPNGAGKSTLLRAMCGLIPLQQGQIALDDRAIAAWPRAQRARMIGYLPQHHVAAWAMPVRDIVGLGRMPWSGDAPAAHDTAIDSAMRRTDIIQFADQPMTALSGGERSRVMLARLLAGSHKILLCDEPLAHMDPHHQLLVMDTLREAASHGQAVAVVMHDLALAARYASRIVVMHQGRIAADGAPAATLSSALLSDVFDIGSLIEQRNDGLLVTPWN